MKYKLSLYRCRNSVKKVCDGEKTFDFDSSESEYTSVSNGDVTFIKKTTKILLQEFILKKMDQVKVMIAKHSASGSCKIRHLSSECWKCQKLVMFLFILQSEILSCPTSYVRNSDIYKYQHYMISQKFVSN